LDQALHKEYQTIEQQAQTLIETLSSPSTSQSRSLHDVGKVSLELLPLSPHCQRSSSCPIEVWRQAETILNGSDLERFADDPFALLNLREIPHFAILSALAWVVPASESP
jgi:hypothetical protein